MTKEQRSQLVTKDTMNFIASYQIMFAACPHQKQRQTKKTHIYELISRR